MRTDYVPRLRLPILAAALTLGLGGASPANAACCYFSAQNADILQPAQRCSSPGIPSRRWKASRCSPSSRATRSTSAWSSQRQPAETARDATGLLQAPRRLFHPQTAGVSSFQAAAGEFRHGWHGHDGRHGHGRQGGMGMGGGMGMMPMETSIHRESAGAGPGRLAGLQDHRSWPRG